MKISELNTKNFLGAAGAATNSYVLVNYEDNSTNEPITYKATIDELGKAIANNLHLYKETQNGAVITSVSQGAYVNGTPKMLMTSSQEAKLNAAVSAGELSHAISSAPYVSMNDVSEYIADEVMDSDGYYLAVASDSKMHIVKGSNDYNGLVETVVTEGWTDPTDSEMIGNFVLMYDGDLYYANVNESGTFTQIDLAGGAPLQAGWSEYTYDTAYIDENGTLIKVDPQAPVEGTNAVCMGKVAFIDIDPYTDKVGLCDGRNNSIITDIATETYVDTAVTDRFTVDASGFMACTINNTGHRYLLPPPAAQTKYVVTASTDGNLYYYDPYTLQYQLVSSLQS